MIKKDIDGKSLIIKGNKKNMPSISLVKSIYSKLPDDKKIPLVFQTKKQYLGEYIKNQEKAHNKSFSNTAKRSYISKELKDMSNIVSRYTTKKNPYIDLRTVFFTDKKISPKQFKDSALHEYAHEAWEKFPKLRKEWNFVNTKNSPTPYGRTDRQEDLAESYMLMKQGKLKDPIREVIIRKNTQDFDMNNDGKINDIDINIMRKKGLLKGLMKDTSSKNSVADALSYNDITDEELSQPTWKVYGAPKQFYPSYGQNLKGNVFNVLNTRLQLLPTKDVISTNLSVTGRLLNKETEKQNEMIKTPVLGKGESFYTKKLDKMHIEGKDGRTKCGRPCLGSNYADTEDEWMPTLRSNLTGSNEKVFYKGGTSRERCPDCFGSRIYGDTPLYSSDKINEAITKANLPMEREIANSIVGDRKRAKQIFRTQNMESSSEEMPDIFKDNISVSQALPSTSQINQLFDNILDKGRESLGTKIPEPMPEQTQPEIQSEPEITDPGISKAKTSFDYDVPKQVPLKKVPFRNKKDFVALGGSPVTREDLSYKITTSPTYYRASIKKPKKYIQRFKIITPPTTVRIR